MCKLRCNFVLQGTSNGSRDELEEVFSFAEKKYLRSVIDKVFRFEQAKGALQIL